MNTVDEKATGKKQGRVSRIAVHLEVPFASDAGTDRQSTSPGLKDSMADDTESISSLVSDVSLPLPPWPGVQEQLELELSDLMKHQRRAYSSDISRAAAAIVGMSITNATHQLQQEMIIEKLGEAEGVCINN